MGILVQGVDKRLRKKMNFFCLGVDEVHGSNIVGSPADTHVAAQPGCRTAMSFHSTSIQTTTAVDRVTTDQQEGVAEAHTATQAVMA